MGTSDQLVMTGSPPMWAQRLLLSVLKTERRSRKPILSWSVTIKLRSTGSTHLRGSNGYSNGKIHVTAGKELLDQRITLLHEIAHWLVSPEHDAKFWKKAWELYRRYGVRAHEALMWETGYGRDESS